VRIIAILCVGLVSCSSALALTNIQGTGPSKKSEPSPQSSPQSLEVLTPLGGVDFTSYTSHLCDSVKRNWYLRMPESVRLGEKGRVVVRFQIQKDGRLAPQTPLIEVSSGRKRLDDAALKSVRDSAPFGKLPDSFSGPNIDLRLTFFYNMPSTSTSQ